MVPLPHPSGTIHSTVKMRQEINLEVFQLRRHKFHPLRAKKVKIASHFFIAFRHSLERMKKKPEKCFSPSSSRKMSLQTLLSSFFLFLVILLLF